MMRAIQEAGITDEEGQVVVGNGSDSRATDHYGISHPRKRAMLSALAKTANVSASARAAGIGRRTHYEWLQSDPAYRCAVDQAMEDAADVLEAVARQRALVGSDTLLIFLLKATRPEKYRDHYHVEHAGYVQMRAQVESFRGSLSRLLRDYPEVVRAIEDKSLGACLPGPKAAVADHPRPEEAGT